MIENYLNFMSFRANWQFKNVDNFYYHCCSYSYFIAMIIKVIIVNWALEQEKIFI